MHSTWAKFLTTKLAELRTLCIPLGAAINKSGNTRVSAGIRYVIASENSTAIAMPCGNAPADEEVLSFKHSKHTGSDHRLMVMFDRRTIL
jgi:hypothetical protein